MTTRVGLVVAFALAVLAGLSPRARADTRRIAIVVGNNVGSSDHKPLRYAEADAQKLANVLVELGGVPADDLLVLAGQGTDALAAAFAQANRRIAELRKDPANHIILLFYFSGHSDGEALELGAAG